MFYYFILLYTFNARKAIVFIFNYQLPTFVCHRLSSQKLIKSTQAKYRQP